MAKNDKMTIAEHRQHIEQQKERAGRKIAKIIENLMDEIDAPVHSVSVETTSHQEQNGGIDQRIVLGVEIKTGKIL